MASHKRALQSDDTEVIITGDRKRLSPGVLNATSPTDLLALRDTLDKSSKDYSALSSHIARKYDALFRCLDCGMALTPATAYSRCDDSSGARVYDGQPDALTAANVSVCRGCYVSKHNGEWYHSAGSMVYYLLELRAPDRPTPVRRRLDFEQFPAKRILRETIRSLIGSGVQNHQLLLVFRDTRLTGTAGNNTLMLGFQGKVTAYVTK